LFAEMVLSYLRYLPHKFDLASEGHCFDYMGHVSHRAVAEENYVYH